MIASDFLQICSFISNGRRMGSFLSGTLGGGVVVAKISPDSSQVGQILRVGIEM